MVVRLGLLLDLCISLILNYNKTSPISWAIRLRKHRKWKISVALPLPRARLWPGMDPTQCESYTLYAYAAEMTQLVLCGSSVVHAIWYIVSLNQAAIIHCRKTGPTAKWRGRYYRSANQINLNSTISRCAFRSIIYALGILHGNTSVWYLLLKTKSYIQKWRILLC